MRDCGNACNMCGNSKPYMCTCDETELAMAELIAVNAALQAKRPELQRSIETLNMMENN